MIRFILGTLFGVYIAQNYNLPNLHNKLIELNDFVQKHKKDEE